jgi:hypothetical protein
MATLMQWTVIDAHHSLAGWNRGFDDHDPAISQPSLLNAAPFPRNKKWKQVHATSFDRRGTSCSRLANAFAGSIRSRVLLWKLCSLRCLYLRTHRPKNFVARGFLKRTAARLSPLS